MRLSLIFFICGIINILLGALMLIPGIVDYFSNQPQNGESFLLCSLGLAFFGAVISALSYRDWVEKPTLKEMFIITSSSWFWVGLMSAVPFYFSGLDLSFTDAVFESISGLTTTGATIFVHVDSLPAGLLLWRALLQWIGGIGIVILAITILPILRIGGMQLFATESSDSSGKDSPFVALKLRRFIYAYIFVTCLCLWALYAAGMSFFDAVAHALTCVSTGGFSTHDLSIGYYNSPLIEWIIIFFMTIGGLPLAVIVALCEGQWEKVKSNAQAKTYLKVLISLIIPISILMWAMMPLFANFSYTLRTFAFHAISIITSTGYVTENYTLWGPFFIVLFFFLTVVGGCTGSTTGGIKIFRFSILSRALKRHLTLMVSPHAVVVPRYNDKPVTDDIMLGVLSFLTIFSLSTIVCTLGLSLTGLDLITSLSGTLTAISNVGPGIGNLIGPDKSFILLPAPAKWLLAIAMMLGRLEFMTIVVLFLPKLWVKN